MQKDSSLPTLFSQGRWGLAADLPAWHDLQIASRNEVGRRSFEDVYLSVDLLLTILMCARCIQSELVIYILHSLTQLEVSYRG